MEPHWGLMSQCGSGSDTSSSLLAWPPRLWRRAMAAPMAALGQDYRCGKGMESYTQSTCSSILIIAKLSPQHPLHCIGWVAPLPLFVPHRWHLHLSPQYDVLDHTNHIFSVRIWSWQYVSVNICWVEPSLLLSSLHHLSSIHHPQQIENAIENLVKLFKEKNI